MTGKDFSSELFGDSPARSGESIFDAALRKEGVSDNLAKVARSIYQQESAGGANTRTSNAGAVGHMQVIPATFNRFADKGWDITRPEDNIRAGLRYIKALDTIAGGEPRLIAAGYYGGEGAIPDARKGKARRDPLNPNAPDTLQYGNQVASRIEAKQDTGRDFSKELFDDDKTTKATPSREPTLERKPAISNMQRFLKGIKDPVDAGAQILYNALPTAVQKAGDSLNNVIADKTGLTTRIPEGGLNASIANDEKAYQEKRGENAGFDAYRLAGNIPPMLPLAFMLPTAAPTLAARSGLGAAAGALGGALPTAAPILAAQSGLGAAAGALGGALPTAAPILAAQSGLGAAAGALGGALPTAAPTLAARFGLGAAAGALGGALQPVTEGEFIPEKMKQAGTGALFGGAVPILGAGISRVISPKASLNPNISMLRKAGVQPTIGQTLGGVANRVEEKMQSLPIIGDAITAARRGSIEGFNRGTINRAIAPVGGAVDEFGTAGVSKGAGAISDAYNVAKSKIGGVNFDGQFAQELGNLTNLAKNLTPEMGKKFEKELRTKVIGRMSPSGGMDATTFKSVDSELGKIASDYRGSLLASEKELGGALRELQAAIRRQAERASPAYAAKMKPADAAFARMVRVENASKKAALQDGVFTPGQLMQAVREGDSSGRKVATARGDALLQEWANAGQQVLGNKYPDSGTAGRLLLGVGGLASGAINPAIPAGLLAGAAAYSSPAQRLAVSLAASRPRGAEPLSGLIRDYSQRLAPAGAMLGNSLLDY